MRQRDGMWAGVEAVMPPSQHSSDIANHSHLRMQIVLISGCKSFSSQDVNRSVIMVHANISHFIVEGNHSQAVMPHSQHSAYQRRFK